MTTTQIYRDQFTYQRYNSVGKILNVGSNTDGARLGYGVPGAPSMGGINLDLRTVDHVTGKQMPVHVLADARALPFRESFDTVVLGEILEHMERPDAVLTLRQAIGALKRGGRVVITMPHDARRDSGTLETPAGDAKFYVPPTQVMCPSCRGTGRQDTTNPICSQCGGTGMIQLGGIYAYHYRSISWPELAGWIAEAGLRVRARNRIAYTWGEVGSGVVCQREAEC